MSYDLLPDACVVNIFSNLTIKERLGVQTVSKRWNSLSLIGVKKVIFVIKFSEKYSNYEHMCPYLHADTKYSLFVSSWEQVLSALKNLPDIVSVKFEMPDCKVTRAIDEVASRISKVKKFAITAPGETEEVKEMITRLTYFTTEIEKLTVKIFDTHGDSNNLNSILQKNRNVKVINLYSSQEPYDIEVNTELKKFRLFGSPFTEFDKNLLNTLKMSSRNTLEVLDIVDSGSVTELNCQCISELRNLKDFRVRIESKDLTHINLQNLEKFEMQLTDKEGSGRSDFSFDVIVTFLEKHTKLTSLKISSEWIAINDDFIKKIVAHGRLRSITNLALPLCVNTTSKSLEYFTNLPNLKSFHLYEIFATNEEDVAVFVRNCLALVSLSVDRFYANTDDCEGLNDQIGGKTWEAFVEKAKLNPLKMFSFKNSSYRYMSEASLKEAPKNLCWRGFIRPLDYKYVPSPWQLALSEYLDRIE